MTRIYEELFIVKPDAADEEVDQYVETLRTQLTTAGATVDKIDRWGKRKLAYRIDKYREGNYVLFQFTSEATAVKELERRLRVSDIVLKFQESARQAKRPPRRQRAGSARARTAFAGGNDDRTRARRTHAGSAERRRISHG
jgi:ribosomal protein S6